MSANDPFDDEAGTFIVLVNDEGQYSLWPAHIVVPQGWTIVQAEDTRAACLKYRGDNWVDMRPKSLVRAMSARASDPSEV